MKVLIFLHSSNVNVDGCLAHMGFILDQASLLVVYTTEGLVLYKRSVATKVLEGVLGDWPKVDSASESRCLSYNFMFDHRSKFDKHDRHVCQSCWKS